MVLDGVELAGLPAHRRRAALVAQQPMPFPHLTVRQNVGFAARGGPETGEVVDYALERFRLLPLAGRAVANLSGGERQRVCLARAVASLPRLLLLDESFSGLHRELRDELLEVLREIQAGPGGMPIVSVTHDVAEAFACGGEVLRIDAGRVVARGAATEVLAAERTELLRRLGSA